MFIAVNYSSCFGMDYQTFKTHKEAYKYLAHSVKESYDNFDLMEFYPFDDIDDFDCELYNSGNGTDVYAEYDWCNCYCNNDSNNYEDHWIIIEV